MMPLMNSCLLLLLLATSCLCQTKLPFKIKGPKSLHDRIAIVGAGPAGIHMALALKERKFTNVVILERSDRLGGKSLTINHRGAPQEMGTVYTQPDYLDLVVPLVHKYVGMNEMRNLPAASIWLDHLKGGITFQQYIIGFAKAHFKTNDNMVAGNKLVEALLKYNYLHKKYLGEYEGEIMPEPSKYILRSQLHGTFLEFLKRHNIEVMASLFYASQSMQGYGRIDEIPTLYGMMWNTPRLVGGLLKRMQGKDNETGFEMLEHGFSNLWEQIVEKEDLRIRYNVRINQIYRPRNGKYGVWVQLRNKPYISNKPKIYHWEKFDFMIWSPDLKKSIQYWDAFNDEMYYFSRSRPTWFTTSLVDTKGAAKGMAPIDYLFDNMNLKRQDSFWAQRDSYPALRDCTGQQYQSGKCPAGNDGRNVRTTVTYQMSDRPPYRVELIRNLKESLYNINATYINIQRMITWRYFPRYSSHDMEHGILWRILEMQGIHGMWYIGSSACFESVKSVIDYNALILKNFDVPKYRKYHHQL